MLSNAISMIEQVNRDIRTQCVQGDERDESPRIEVHGHQGLCLIHWENNRWELDETFGNVRTIFSSHEVLVAHRSPNYISYVLDLGRGLLDVCPIEYMKDQRTLTIQVIHSGIPGNLSSPEEAFRVFESCVHNETSTAIIVRPEQAFRVVSIALGGLSDCYKLVGKAMQEPQTLHILEQGDKRWGLYIANSELLLIGRLITE